MAYFKMLISIVSLLMNVTIYAILLLLVIIGCDYALIAIQWTKETLIEMINNVRNGIRSISETLGNVQGKISGITRKLANLNLNPLDGICS